MRCLTDSPSSGSKTMRATIASLFLTLTPSCHPSNHPSNQASPAIPTPVPLAPAPTALAPTATPTTLPTAETKAEDPSVKLAADVRRAVLERINHDRKVAGLLPVTEDKIAQMAGDAHCQDMVRINVPSHSGSNGQLPYMRYSLGHGGLDRVQENFGMVTAGEGSVIDTSALVEKAVESHGRMYDEKPPNDGHRLNILDPSHTGVGIGVAFSEKALCMTEEFVGHHVDMQPIVKNGNGFETSGTALEGRVIGVIVTYEPEPVPLSPEQLWKTGAYAFPKTQKKYLPKPKNGEIYMGGSARDVELQDGGRAFKLHFPAEHGPGIYTVLVWIDHPQFGKVMATTVSVRY